MRTMEAGQFTFSFSSSDSRYYCVSAAMPFLIFQESFSAQWITAEELRPVSEVMNWIIGTLGSEKKQAGALGSIVRLKIAWPG